MKKRSGHEKLRYRLIYKGARRVIPHILKKYEFTTDTLDKTDENYIVLANHLTEVDMLIVAAAMKEHMYFVAGEHLIRSKYGFWIQWSQNPIFECKGASALNTVREIIKRVKDGNNVMIFPEGSRSFHGATLKQPDAIAKLIKKAGCGLVTYHIEGGYFVAPRWAYTARTGPMRGRIMQVRSAEQVKAMSVKELTEAINRELYENAYETQGKKRYKYKGERLAEGIENYLVKCSCCGKFDTILSKYDMFMCEDCGMVGTYTEEGFLEGDGLRFHTVYDWGKWAEQETESYIEGKESGQLCFEDAEVKVYQITEDHKQIDLFSGKILGYSDRICVGEEVYLFEDIPVMNMLYYGKTLLFTCNKRVLGITGEQFHAIKYHKLYECYKKKDEIS